MSDSPYPPPPVPEKKYRVRIWLKWGTGFYDMLPGPGFNMQRLAQEIRGAGGFFDASNWIPLESILGVALVEEVQGKPPGQVVPFSVVPKEPEGAA